jgi:hypothetical protein
MEQIINKIIGGAVFIIASISAWTVTTVVELKTEVAVLEVQKEAQAEQIKVLTIQAQAINPVLADIYEIVKDK